MSPNNRRIGQPFRGGGQLFHDGAKHYSDSSVASHFSTTQQNQHIHNGYARAFQIFAARSHSVYGRTEISPSSLLFAVASYRHKGHNTNSSAFSLMVIREVVSKAAYRSDPITQQQRVVESVKGSYFGAVVNVLRFAVSSVALFWGQAHDFKAIYDEISKNPLYGDYPEGGVLTEDDRAKFTTKSATMTFQDDGVGSYRDGVNPYKEGQFS